MGNYFKINHILLLSTLIMSFIFYGCKEDVFDAEKVQATYQDKFPVKDIDPQMDWKTTCPVDVSISVYEDYGTDYTVEVFDYNPYATDAVAHLLASGTANQDLIFQTTIDCPLTLERVYVSRMDSKGRRIMKVVPVSNRRIETTFGIQALTRSSARAGADEGEVQIKTMARPYTDSEIEELLSKATVYNGQDMDTDIARTNIFKITKSYSGGINHGGATTPDAGTLKLIIAPGAKWEIPSPQVINQGLEIIVASRGAIGLKSGGQYEPSLRFTNSSSLVVLGTAYQEDEPDAAEDTRGKITGKGWIEFSNGGTNYNAGKIDVDGINNNGGTLYNYGEIDAGKLLGSSTESLYVNHGDVEVHQIGDNQSTGPQLENSCKIDVENFLASNGIKMGKGSLIEAKHLYAYNYIDLDANSMIDIENTTNLSNCNITGPTAAKSYALLKLEHINQANWTGSMGTEVTQGYVINNVYCEYKKAVENFDNYCLNGTAGGSGHKGNGNATICLPGKAPSYIPEGRCTGAGNTPDESGDDVNPGEMPYTYAFEDNYPLVGDYDFNDIVLDVTTTYHREKKTNHIKRIQLNVTLAATGAVKSIGAALRIVNINKADIKSISPAGDYKRFHATLGSDGFFTFDSGTCMENGDNAVVIPLFGNAHKVYDGVEQGKIVNTGSGTTAKAYTYELIIELADQSRTVPLFSKDNLDFFICYKYRNMQKRMEIHLYEFWKYGATANGTVQQSNLDLAGNNTWAICVPDFRYPKERINISNQKDESDCAYPKFLDWARNRETNKDWYKYPIAKNIYR